ncbi:MAG: molybdopterin molybdotransferase MoeA [Candidatus Omnitrophica bacterium]|nr:molybdopterin molybdotransferase MoeA [Candidatus Omnitrophota bacterium]
MITWNNALELIFKNTKTLGIQKTKVTESVGKILAEDIYSSINMPPFNKSAMDGYALSGSNAKKLKCIGTIQAGDVFTKKVRSKECVKIMTGACVPSDIDRIVKVEDTHQLEKNQITIKPVKKLANICFKGEDIKKGQKVLNKGTKISTSHINLLAAVGKAYIFTVKKPKVAILNTGNEIVSAGKKLKKNKIYNSNGPQLESLLKDDNIDYVFLGIAKDKPKQLSNYIKKGLECDMLLITGGVSMGDYDLVPDALKNLGVKNIFHKVKIKPGKPVFFGIKSKTIIFGMPGNPVSIFLSYQLFIRSALRKMMGYKKCQPKFNAGTFTQDFVKKSTRRQFISVKISEIRGRIFLTPVKGNGSADIFSLSKTDGFMAIEEKLHIVKKNSLNNFITWKKIP